MPFFTTDDGVRLAYEDHGEGPVVVLVNSLQDWRDVAARAGCPVLMVAGRDSRLWPCEHAAATIAGNPNGRSVIIEDCGHPVNIDQPDRLDEVLLEFLAESAPAR